MGVISKSTVSREFRRNGTSDGYVPENAQRLCEKRRVTAAKRSVSQNTIDFIEFALGYK